MKTYDFYTKNTKNSVIALGFFDSMHVGHQKVLTTCRELSQKLSAEAIAFTFSESLSVVGKGEKLLSTYDERLNKFAECGIQSVLKAPCDETFFAISPIDFLIKLKDDFHVVGIVCGEDFTFGAGGYGDVEFLQKFCKERDITLTVVSILTVDSKKIGARDIKRLVNDGKIEEANKLLGYNYSINGIVKKGRGDGAKYVVPTLNIDYPKDKVIPKCGVYVTKTMVDGVSYLSITNIGEHPTFGDLTKNIETYLIDTNLDLYGREVRVEFLHFIREIKKFNDAVQLKLQIEKDVEIAREI